jgi:hypothetical protein
VICCCAVLKNAGASIFRVEDSSTLKREAENSSQTLLPTYQATWLYIPDDDQNIKSRNNDDDDRRILYSSDFQLV